MTTIFHSSLTIFNILFKTGKGELWVEKYRPKNYRQLLSDEGTNRTLLQWLKLWDKAVFDRDLPKHLNKYEEIRVGKGKKTGEL
jgi:hypothetical protein